MAVGVLQHAALCRVLVQVAVGSVEQRAVEGGGSLVGLDHVERAARLAQPLRLGQQVVRIIIGGGFVHWLAGLVTVVYGCLPGVEGAKQTVQGGHDEVVVGALCLVQLGGHGDEVAVVLHIVEHHGLAGTKVHAAVVALQQVVEVALLQHVGVGVEVGVRLLEVVVVVGPGARLVGHAGQVEHVVVVVAVAAHGDGVGDGVVAVAVALIAVGLHGMAGHTVEYDAHRIGQRQVTVEGHVPAPRQVVLVVDARHRHLGTVGREVVHQPVHPQSLCRRTDGADGQH